MNRKSAIEVIPTSTDSLTDEDEHNSEEQDVAERRAFLKKSLVAGAVATAGVGVLAKVPSAFGQTPRGSLTKGDVAILRFLAAAEIIESDLWLQYQELGGVQDDEVSQLASKLIPGYPAQPTGGNPLYMQDLLPLDGDMSQYIHDNTEDELTHEVFINKYLASKGAPTVNLDQFQTWQDKAGNAPQLTDVVDPVTGVKVTFPDLNSPPLGGEDFQTNLIMPEPTVFLNKQLPACSIIRPTATNGAAMGALQSLTADGLFIGQSKAFFTFLRDLAENADAARRHP